MKRNAAGGRAIPPDTVGAYEREHAATFGAGTLGRCDHDWWKKCEIYWVQQMTGGYWVKTFPLSHPDDRVGDRRCRKCGKKEIAL